MGIDARGHIISTDSNEAATALSAAIEAFAARQSIAASHMQKAIAADPECAFGQAMMGIMLLGARTTALREQAKQAMVAAEKHSQQVSTREKQYVKALQHTYAGQLEDAVRCYEAVLAEHPTDLLALVFLQSELFWLGDMVWTERVSAQVAPHWNADVPGYTAFLAIRAFDLEENNRFAEGEQVTQEALKLNPADVWGAHAFAHIMLMQNRIDEGIAWMDERQSLWDDANQMQYHLAWHHCLFLGERHQHEKMLAIYDERIRNRDHALCAAMPDLYIDLQNGSSLLWRLEQAGVDVGNRWQELADVCAPRVNDMSNPFTSAHFALVLAANEQFDACDELIAAMESFANDTNHDLALRYRKAALPAAKAAIAHRKGDHHGVIQQLKPAQQDLWNMGGSHAQQDLYYQIWADSAAKQGDKKAYADLMHVIEKIGFVEPTARIAYAQA